jgi:formate/nitrite transporter FocA (FNT family)
MEDLMEKIRTFFEAVAAGVFIGIAGTVFLSVENRVIGAFLFALGLLAILCFQLKLYTGAVGYIVYQKKNTLRYLLELLIIWAGNFAGTFLVGKLLLFTRIAETVSGKALLLCNVKMADSFVSIFILSIFCGILMFSGVEAFKRKDLPDFGRVSMVFLCVSVFILCGFEHCIANMYYFSAAGVWSWHALLYILLMTLGNALGSWLIPLADKIRKD